jgi:hypothetical protein
MAISKRGDAVSATVGDQAPNPAEALNLIEQLILRETAQINIPIFLPS